MTEERINELAKNLTENIENGTLQRKTDSFSTDYYDSAVAELCLFKYKRYLGSLRCLLDTQNMWKGIPGHSEDNKSYVKRLKKIWKIK